MTTGDFAYVSLSNSKYIITIKEELKKLVLADKYFLGRHFFEYATLFQLQNEEGLLTEEEFESIKNRLSPDCCYVESYPISDFLGGEDIKVKDDAIPVFLLEFLISKPQNFFSMQNYIFDCCDDPLYRNFSSFRFEKCAMNCFDLDMIYLSQLHEGMRELYKKLEACNYELHGESGKMLKLFNEGRITGENVLFLIKYKNFTGSSIKKDEFISGFDPKLVDGVIELLKKEAITKEEIEEYLKENNSLFGYENYMFLIKNVKDMTDTFLEYDEILDKNLDEIFYSNDIHYCFYPMLGNVNDEDEFVNGLGEQLSGVLDQSILDYVHENLPDNLEGTKELAFCLYVLLGDVLQYDAAYVLDKNCKLNWMKDLTIENNKVICGSWAASYYKLLEHYGIESYVDGCDHFSVFIPDGHTLYEADATTVVDGLSDLATIKFNFYPQSFIVDRVSSCSTNEMEFRNNELEEIKESVYKKMGRNVVSLEEFDERTVKFQSLLNKRILPNKWNLTRDDFDKTIRCLNRFYNIPLGIGADVERGEFFNKYIDMVINEFPEGTVESISLYRVEDDVVSYAHLLSMKDKFGEKHLYLENDKGFVSCNGEDVLKEVESGKIAFHNPFSYEKVKSLCKRPNEVVSNMGEFNE